MSRLSSKNRQTQSHRLEGCFLVLLAVFGFSAKAILVKLAYADSPALDAITLMLLRMAISLPFFLAVSIRTANSRGAGYVSSLSKEDYGLIFALGFLGYYLASFLDFAGLAYISAGLERLILFLYPTLVVLLTALFFRQKIERRQAAALLLCYAGMALVYLDQSRTAASAGLLRGAFLIAGSALSFALFMAGSGIIIKRIGAVRFTVYTMTVACVLTILHFVTQYGFRPLRLPLAVYALAALMAMFSTVLPAFLMSAGIQRVGAGTAAIISSAGPVITLILAYFLLAEPITLIQQAGTFLVLLGVYLVGRDSKRSEK